MLGKGQVELTQQRPSATEGAPFITLEALPNENDPGGVGQRIGLDAADLENGVLALRHLLYEFTRGGWIGLFQQPGYFDYPPTPDHLR